MPRYSSESQSQEEAQRNTLEAQRIATSPERVAANEQRADEKMMSELASRSALPEDQVSRILGELRGGQLNIQDASKQTDDLAEQFFTDSLASGMSGLSGPMDIFKAIADDPFVRAIREEKSFADDPINRFGGKALIEASRSANIKNPQEFAQQMQLVSALPPTVRDELVRFTETLTDEKEREDFRAFYFEALNDTIDEYIDAEAKGRDPHYFEAFMNDQQSDTAVSEGNPAGTNYGDVPKWAELPDGSVVPFDVDQHWNAMQRAGGQYTPEKGSLEEGEVRGHYIHPKYADVYKKFQEFRGQPNVLTNLLYTGDELGRIVKNKNDSVFTKLGITALVQKAAAPLPDALTEKFTEIGAPIYNTDFFMDVSLSDIDDSFAHPLRTLDRETEQIGRVVEGTVEAVGYGGGALINDVFNASQGDVDFSHTREYIDYARATIDQNGGFENPDAWLKFFRDESKRINIGDVTPLPDWFDGGAPLRFLAVPSTLIGGAELKAGLKLGFKPAGATIKIPMGAFSKMAPDTSYRIAAWWAAKNAPRKQVLERLLTVKKALPSQFTVWLNNPVKGVYTSTGEEILYRGVDDVAHITPENQLANGQQLAGRTVVNLTPAVDTALQFTSALGDILMTNVARGLRFIDTGSAEYDEILEKIVTSPEYAALEIGQQQAFRDSVLEGLGFAGQVVHKQGHPILRLFDQANATVLGSRKLNVAAENGNDFVAYLRPLDGPQGVVSEISALEEGRWFSNNSIIRALVGRTGINPSILRYTPIGRLVTGFMRQTVSIDALTANAVGLAIDNHAQRFTGRLIGTTKVGATLFQIDETGRLLNVGARRAGAPMNWNDVFRRPQDYILNDAQQAFVDDVIKLTREVEDMRALAGLKRLNTLKDGFYIPRQVRGVKDVLLEGTSDPNLKRLYENASDGVANGIQYSRDIRAVLELHVKTAYQEIASKQLSDAVAQYGVKSSDLVGAGVTNKFYEAAATLNSEKALSRATLSAQEALVGTLNGAAKKSAQARLDKMRVAEAARIADLEKAAKPIFKEYKNAVAAAAKLEVAPGNLFGRAEERIGIARWKGIFFPRADQKLLTMAVDGLNPNANGFIWRQLERIGNTTRYLSSVGDFAAPFVQGLPVLARDPVAWGRAAGMHYIAWFDPSVQSRFLREHRATMAKAARYGMAMGDNEFYRAATAGGGFNVDALIGRLPAGDALTNFRQGVSRQTFGRFQASYNTFLVQSRVLMWEGLEESWTRNGGKLSDLAAHINNLTGGLDPRALGITAPQRAFESMWMAFSPRLLRSTVGLIADLRFGIRHPRGRSAFTALGRLTSGAAAAYTAAATLQGINEGKSPDEILDQIREGMNPLNGKKFLSLNVNGDWIGVGGQIRAITQLMATVAATADSPLDLVSTDLQENPLAKFWLNRGAPGPNVVGAIGEGLTSGDFLPYEEVDGLPDIAMHLGESALPFAVQARMEGENWSSVFASMAGARTSRETTSEARDYAAREWNPYRGNNPLTADMSPEDKERAAKEVEQHGYRGLEERERIAFDQQNAGRFNPSTNVSEQVQLGRTITAAKDNQLAELDAVVQGEPFFKRQYAERRGEIMTGSAWARNNLVDFEKGFEPDSTQGKARDLYFETLKEYQDGQPGNVLNGEEFGEAEAEAMNRIREQLGDEGVRALERSFITGKTATEREYRSAVQSIDKFGYWNMNEDTIEFLNSAAGEAKYGEFPFESFAEFKEFIDTNSAEEGTVPEQTEAWKLVVKLTSKARQIRRINNPELDAMLVIWFGSSPLTTEAQQIAERSLGRKVELSSDSPELDK